MSEPNGIATAEDFKAATFEKPEQVVLPFLKKAVLLRRPSPLWFLLQGRMPVTLAAKLSQVDGIGAEGLATAMNEWAQWVYEALSDIMVKPRLSMHPQGPDEISPAMIDISDVKFMMAWAAGEEVDGTRSLATFREERSASDTGTTG
jgi:hypothetical protein